MTVDDLEIGQIYEVVERIPIAYSAISWPELSEIMDSNNNIRIGALMEYVSYDRTDKLVPYGFYFIIDGKIVKNIGMKNDLFWFSKEELQSSGRSPEF